MSNDELKVVLHDAFPDLEIRELKKLGSGKFAWAYLVNNEIVFKIPKPGEDLHMADNRKEIEFLKYLYGKLGIATPNFICSGTTSDGTLIVGQSLLPGITYSQELHDSFDENTKSKILEQLGRIMRELHSVPTDDAGRPHANTQTPADSINTFNTYFSDAVRAQFSDADLARVQAVCDRYKYLSENYPVAPVITQCDFHFGNLMFDTDKQKLIGLIDFGAAHYDEPARDMHYYYGDGAAALLRGYGDNGDAYLPERQLFQSVVNMLCNIKEDMENNKSPDRNVQKVLRILPR